MKVGEYCTREVIVADGTTGIVEAAQLMRENNVGTIVIVERGDGNRPVGIVTDRDLVVEVLAPELDMGRVTCGDLPMRDLITVGENDDLMDTLTRMGQAGVRRVPVVNSRGELEGLLAMDDVFTVISEMMNDLVQLVVREVDTEVHVRG
jgi:predicted transcriptional regulator